MNPDEKDGRAMPLNAMPSNEDAADPSAPGREAPDRTSDGSPETGEAAAPSARAADVQAYIGRQLRAVYDDVVKQPIPDRFLALMKQLEEGTRDT